MSRLPFAAVIERAARVAGWSTLACMATGCQNLMWYGHDTDRATSVELFSRCGEQFVVVGGAEHASHDAVAMEMLAVSARGRVAYAARDETAWSVYVDGHAVGPAVARVGYVGWGAAPDMVIAVVGDDRGDRVLVMRSLGGHRWHTSSGPPFEAIAAGSIVSTTTGIVGYVGWRGHAAHAVSGAEVGPAFDGIADLHLTPEGLASYAARKGDAAWVVRRGVYDGPYEDVAAIESDAAGRRVVALVRSDDAWRADDGSWRSPAYDRIGDVVLSARTSKLAFRAGRTDDEVVVVDGEELGPYLAVIPKSLRIGGPTDRVVFAARDGDGEHVVIDGQATAAWLGIEELALADDGRVGFVAKTEGARVVVIDGEHRGAWSWAGDLRLAPSGRDVFVARDRGRDVVIDGGRRHEFDQVVRGTLRFAADGTTWGAVVFVDGQLVLAHAGGLGPRIDIEEIAGELLRRRDPSAHASILSDWITAELEVVSRGR